MEWRVAPPAAKPSSLASYLPRIRPMNSLMQFPNNKDDHDMEMIVT